MRIVGGDLRGRPLAVPADRQVRPTTDRVREALFNILTHADWAEGALEEAQVLDACCGSGALGLEALSRGAAACSFMDLDGAHLDLARRNAASLGVEGRCRFIRADVSRPPMASEPAGLVLFDPPYRSDLAARGLRALADAGWTGPGTLVALEQPGKSPVPEIEGFEPVDHRRYGATGLVFLRA